MLFDVTALNILCRTIIRVGPAYGTSGATPFDTLCALTGKTLNVASSMLDLLHMHCNKSHSSGTPFKGGPPWPLRRTRLKREFIDE